MSGEVAAKPDLDASDRLVRVIATSMGGDAMEDLQLPITSTGAALRAALVKQIAAGSTPWRLKLVCGEDLVSDGVSLESLVGKGDDCDLDTVRVQLVKLPRPTIELKQKAGQPFESPVILKVLLMGSANTGKTALMLRAVDDVFSEAYMPTIGVDFRVQYLVVNDTTNVKLQVWDTAGQERFREIIKPYIRGHHLAIVVFSILNRASFLEAQNCVETIRDCVPSECSGPPRLLSIVGTHCDRAAERVVSEEEARRFAESLGAGVTYVEATATTLDSATEVFHSRIEDLLERAKLLEAIS